MADLAVLGLEIRSEGAAKAASDLDKLSASAGKAEKASNDLGAASEKNSSRNGGMSKATERTLAALERMEAIMCQQSQMFVIMRIRQRLMSCVGCIWTFSGQIFRHRTLPTVYSFRGVTLSDWRQFESIDLDLTLPVTILTGVNGSGKTTLLRLLAHYVGNGVPFLATPQRPARDGTVAWWTGFSRKFLRKSQPQIAHQHKIGSVSFNDGNDSALTAPMDAGSAQVQVNHTHYVHVQGMFVASHRPSFNYSSISNLSIARQERRSAYQNYANILSELTRTNGGYIQSAGVSNSIKSTLLNWGYVGYGSRVAPEDPELIRNFEGFQDILKLVLPKELNFQKYEIRSGTEIVFICSDSEFILETASGGISSLIHLAWMLFNFDNNETSTILIDEIENHLHPSLQRIVLPNLTAAFPHFRFIVTTHSPLVVSSVRGARVYALKHGETGGIVHQELDFSSDAQTATDVLDNVLGVPVTMPTWAEEEYEEIIDRYVSQPADKIDLHAFRAELIGKGLRKFVLQGVDRVLEAKQ